MLNHNLEGYSLVNAEVYNWGNFYGWHRVNLMQPTLISKTAFFRNSMMAGENGSGKSTIMDGIISMIFPFSTSLKMGVIDNTEDNSSGGRKLADYVLGKYGSSSNDGQALDMTKVFGRKSGISAFLIQFQHNSDPSKKVTIGRMWWFSDYKLKANDQFFLVKDHISIADPNQTNILFESSLPRTPKELKAVLDGKVVGASVYDQAKDYFTDFSQIFGGMTKEDLKLLMKAATVKKISEIDPFIRENMLLASPTDSITRLISSVSDADAISKDIDLYLEKIESMDKVVKELNKDADTARLKSIKQVEQKVLQGFGYWKDQQSAQQEIETLETKIEKLLNKNPELNSQLEAKNTELDTIQNELNQKDVASRIKTLESQKAVIQKELQILAKEWKKVETWLENAGLNLKSQNIEVLKESLKSQVDLAKANAQQKQVLEEKVDGLKQQLKETQNQAQKIQNDLESLSKHKTRIPFDLYSLKNRIIQELGLPANSLMFVGELVEVKKECQSFLKAVETTLNPISRNLLCLPDHIQEVTQWLNENKVYQTVVMKRISESEMERPAQLKFANNSTLSKLEVKPESENPFYNYIWNWLINGFDFKVVSAQDFQRADLEKAVTLEGLVKTDRRTQRKNSERMEFYLGWNHEGHEQDLAANLQVLENKSERVKNEIKTQSDQLSALLKKGQMIDSLSDMDLTHLESSANEDQVSDLDAQIESLTKNNSEYDDLKHKESNIKSEIRLIQQNIADLSSESKQAEAQIQKLKDGIAEKAELLTRLFAQVVNGKELNQWVKDSAEEFKKIESKLEESSMDIFSYNQAVEAEVTELSRKLDESRSKIYLRDYEKQYNDPSLVYRINSEAEIEQVKIIWEARKAEFESVGLKEAKKKWEVFYSSTLVEYIKTASMEIHSEQNRVKDNIDSINEVLKKMDFEKIAAANETRFVQIRYNKSQDERVVLFNRELGSIELDIHQMTEAGDSETKRASLMTKLNEFVVHLKEEQYSDFVTDVRNHYSFIVNSYSRTQQENGDHKLVEVFQGAKKDGKSGGQTVQLTYTLLAAALAYRMNFFHPVKGKDTLRLIILDEFGNNFDNEKPKASIELFNQMGFQCLFILPMTKTDLLSDYVNTFTAVYKKSASESKIFSYKIESSQEFREMVQAEGKDKVTE